MKNIVLLAYFIHHCRWGERVGGSEVSSVRLFKHLEKLGVRVCALEMAPLLKESLPYASYGSLKVYLNSNNSVIRWLISVFYLCLTSLRLCRDLSFDLIYVTRQDLLGNIIPAFMVSLFFKKPLLINFLHLSPKEKLSIKELFMLRLRQGFSLPSAILLTLLDVIKIFIFRRATCVAISKSTVKDVTEYFGIQKVFVIKRGIDFDEFEAVSAKCKAYDAAFLGRITIQNKGIDTLLKAWKMVIRKLPSARLILIGGGREMEICRRMINRLALQANVKMTGFVPPGSEELIRSLKSSKIFVFPSRYEGFGRAVAEAMACGLPCVVSDIPALRENFGEVAITINPDDAKGFAGAILDLLTSPDKREALGRRGQEYVKKFNWDEVARKEIEVFQRLLD